MQDSPSMVQTELVKTKKTQIRRSNSWNSVQETNLSKYPLMLPNENVVEENLTNKIDYLSTNIHAPAAKKCRAPVMSNNHPENQIVFQGTQ